MHIAQGPTILDPKCRGLCSASCVMKAMHFQRIQPLPIQGRFYCQVIQTQRQDGSGLKLSCAGWMWTSLPTLVLGACCIRARRKRRSYAIQLSCQSIPGRMGFFRLPGQDLFNEDRVCSRQLLVRVVNDILIRSESRFFYKDQLNEVQSSQAHL